MLQYPFWELKQIGDALSDVMMMFFTDPFVNLVFLLAFAFIVAIIAGMITYYLLKKVGKAQEEPYRNAINELDRLIEEIKHGSHKSASK